MKNTTGNQYGNFDSIFQTLTVLTVSFKMAAIVFNKIPQNMMHG